MTYDELTGMLSFEGLAAAQEDADDCTPNTKISTEYANVLELYREIYEAARQSLRFDGVDVDKASAATARLQEALAATKKLTSEVPYSQPTKEDLYEVIYKTATQMFKMDEADKSRTTIAAHRLGAAINSLSMLEVFSTTLVAPLEKGIRVIPTFKIALLEEVYAAAISVKQANIALQNAMTAAKILDGELDDEYITEIILLKSVYEAAKQFVQVTGIDETQIITATDRLYGAIDAVKSFDGGTST